MTELFTPSLRDRALGAIAHDRTALEARSHHERKRWVALQRSRFVSQMGELGRQIVPEMVSFVETGDGAHQELCHEVEGVMFRMMVDYQVHHILDATLVCSYCGQGCVTRRVYGLEDLGAAYEEMACHEERCLDGLMREAHAAENPEHEQRGLNLGCSSPEEYAALEAER
jgi:hypothetical protein